MSLFGDRSLHRCELPHTTLQTTFQSPSLLSGSTFMGYMAPDSCVQCLPKPSVICCLLFFPSTTIATPIGFFEGRIYKFSTNSSLHPLSFTMISHLLGYDAHILTNLLNYVGRACLTGISFPSSLQSQIAPSQVSGSQSAAVEIFCLC